MNKVVILTDSTADLSQEYLITEDVQSVPLFIRFEDEVYRDGVDITADELFEKVSNSNEIARSTGLRSGDFHNTFNKYIKRGYDIVYLGIGSNLSSTIQSALIAKQELETSRVYIVDSKTVSAGLGLLVMHAVELRKQGYSAHDIKKRMDELVPRVHFYYMISDLDLLYQTSRIKTFNLKLAKLFQSKPVLTMMNDRIERVHRLMGPLDKKIETFIRMIEKKLKDHTMTSLVMTHSCSHEIAQKAFELMKQRFNPKVMVMNPLGCVLGAQLGKNTLGIAYFV